MKKVLAILFTASLFLSCGGGNDASKLAKNVCDCYTQANGMEAADPKRKEAQNECLKKQGDSWNKIKDDEQKAKEFNKIIGECASEEIKRSFGQ